MNDSLRIQELVQEHFEETDPQLFIEIVDAFVYEKGSTNPKVSEEVDKFLSVMGIKDDYVTYLTTKDNLFVKSKAIFEVIYDIKFAMLNTSHNNARWYFNKLNDKKIESDSDIASAKNRLDIQIINTKIANVMLKSEKSKSKFLSKKLLDLLESLNRSENYFYSEKEDAELVETINYLMDENRTNTPAKPKGRKK
jgi:hypothetical protein